MTVPSRATSTCVHVEEFLQAEGLTEQQLRAACEKEMRLADDSGGPSFTHILLSSWEFERLVGATCELLDVR